MKNTLHLFVDFDHTLFNTDAFLNRAFAIASEYGVSKKSFYETFETITDRSGDKAYSFSAHIQELRRKIDIDYACLYRDLRTLLFYSQSFLYEDSICFMRELKRWNASISIVTYANKQMRQKQISACELRKLIDRLYILEKGRSEKIQLLKEFANLQRFSLLIDDHPKILAPFRYSTIFPIRIRRRVLHRFNGCEPDLAGVPTFRNLSEAYVFLEPILKSYGKR